MLDRCAMAAKDAKAAKAPNSYYASLSFFGGHILEQIFSPSKNNVSFAFPS